MTMIAYAYRSGEIGFCADEFDVPDGAIPFTASRVGETEHAFRDRVSVRTLHIDDGAAPHVPGLQAASTEQAAFKVLNRWAAWAFPPHLDTGRAA